MSPTLYRGEGGEEGFAPQLVQVFDFLVHLLSIARSPLCRTGDSQSSLCTPFVGEDVPSRGRVRAPVVRPEPRALDHRGEDGNAQCWCTRDDE